MAFAAPLVAGVPAGILYLGPYCFNICFQVPSMNWNKPVALEPFALIPGWKPDSCAAIPANKPGSTPTTLAAATMVSFTAPQLPEPVGCGTLAKLPPAPSPVKAPVTA